uniref:Sirtuin 4 n=1 Tax=Leptobrachium leishanense TaxID=445787 RepID=A0A8C5P9M5_9ANUR
MAGIKILLLSITVAFSAYYFFSTETVTPGSVHGKRILVTGSSTGIGEQIAYEFAQMGAHVMLTARRETHLQKVAEKCRKLGALSAHYVVSDMANLTSAQHVIQVTNEKLGGLDYLILNHVGGSGSFGTFQGDMDVVKSSMTVNFLSYVQLTSSALHALKESHGSIVVMSSMSGRVGAPFTTSYCAAKFALEGFYSSLRREFSIWKNNVSVTVAVLGYIDTENAVKKVGDKLTMKPSPKEDCAKQVVKAAILRQPEVFYPFWSIKPVMLVKDWAPILIGNLLDRFYIVENLK